MDASSMVIYVRIVNDYSIFSCISYHLVFEQWTIVIFMMVIFPD
jgi:hypothetical protein